MAFSTRGESQFRFKSEQEKEPKYESSFDGAVISLENNNQIPQAIISITRNEPLLSSYLIHLKNRSLNLEALYELGTVLANGAVSITIKSSEFAAFAGVVSHTSSLGVFSRYFPQQQAVLVKYSWFSTT